MGDGVVVDGGTVLDPDVDEMGRVKLKGTMRRALRMLVTRADTLPLPPVPAMWMVGRA